MTKSHLISCRRPTRPMPTAYTRTYTRIRIRIHLRTHTNTHVYTPVKCAPPPPPTKAHILLADAPGGCMSVCVCIAVFLRIYVYLYTHSPPSSSVMYTEARYFVRRTQMILLFNQVSNGECRSIVRCVL